MKISKEWKYSYIKFLSNLVAFINKDKFDVVIDLTLNFTCNLIFIYQKNEREEFKNTKVNNKKRKSNGHESPQKKQKKQLK